MIYIKLELNQEYRGEANAVLKKAWGSTQIVIHGEWFDLSKSKAFICIECEKIIGVVTYYFKNGICEVTSLISVQEHLGVGQKLMRLIADECKIKNAKKMFLVTTNDCIRAIKFYQQFGMDLEAVRLNQLDMSRKIKPEIPLIGEHGIPLKHELQFYMLFT